MLQKENRNSFPFTQKPVHWSVPWEGETHARTISSYAGVDQPRQLSKESVHLRVKLIEAMVIVEENGSESLGWCFKNK